MNYRHMPIVSYQEGRKSLDLSTIDIKPRSLYFFKMNLDQGGFDNGGAKWSLHKPLYCVSDGTQPLAFVYASDKTEAALALEVDPSWLKYLDVHIPVVKKGGMFHVVNEKEKTVGFAVTHTLARTKWYEYQEMAS